MRMIVCVTAMLLLVTGCGPQNPTLTPLQSVGEYGVKVEKFTSQMQMQVANSTLHDDLKAKAMVGFREVGVQIENLGKALTAYDVALKAGQAVSGGEALTIADRVKSGLLAVITIVRGASSPVADQLVQTFTLVEQALLELRVKLAGGK